MPRWHAHPDVLLVVGALAFGYWWLATRIGPKHVPGIERPVTRRQVWAFGGGLAVMFAFSTWPIHDYAEGRLYFVHMLQHMAYTFVVPPLLLMGMPAWMLRVILGRRGMQAARFLGKPIVGIIAFNGMLALSHMPAFVSLSVRSELFHFGAHVAIVGTAFMMWSPVLTPLIELPKLSYPGRMVYLFLQSLVPTVPASFLTFGSTVLYKVYDHEPRMWGLSALNDQLIAGLTMKLLGGFIIWGVMGYYFFKWASVERRENVDVLEWSKLERDPSNTELAKR